MGNGRVTSLKDVASAARVSVATVSRLLNGTLDLPTETKKRIQDAIRDLNYQPNPHARRLLAEAAWAYQGVPRIGRQMLYRQETLPKTVCDIAWKAQLRLTARFRKLVARGKAKPKVATAIARELTGFIWAIAREVPAPPA